MKALSKARAAFGLGTTRALPPPRLTAIAEGLLVTERKAEAWYLLGTENTDLASEADRDEDLDKALSVISQSLADRDCHLKIVWGRVSGDEYRAEGERLFPAGNGKAWAETRAARIDELALPQRHLLLGVHLGDRDTRDTAHLRGSVTDALGLSTWQVNTRELAHLDARMRKTGRQLANSVWRARPASAEQIAWMVGREQHRQTTAAPRAGVIAGASLARLTHGRVQPYSDHLRVLGPRGEVTSYVAVLMLTEFPEHMEVPGAGEWLRTLSEITYVDDDGDEHAVVAEASVRFRAMSKSAAIKVVEEQRRSAKEQRKSAEKHSAGETTEEIEATEAVMGETRRRIQRDGLTLIEDHPRIVVNASSYAELDTHVDAVITHYSELGITAVVGADEQRDLWLETLAGDTLRVPDLGHVREDVAFAGSWFWGGAAVGDDSGPAIGVLTGTTPGLVRNDVAGGSARGDATTTLWCGRSGRGKTTAMMWSTIDAAAGGAWVPFLDFKGDCGGQVAVAKEYGLPSSLVRIGAQHSGAADMFRVLPPQDATLYVTGQLTMLTPKNLRGAAEQVIMAATRTVAGQSNPSSWAVIERLCSLQGVAGEIGEALRVLADTPLGAAVCGPPTGDVGLTTEPGLWVIQMPGMTLPSTVGDPEDWSPMQRVSMACLRGFIAHVVYTAGRQDLLSLAKVVAIPEVHLLTLTPDGRQFLDYIARVGRALGTALLLDTQDPGGINELPGLVEQITTVFGFQLTTKAQQSALAELLNLPPDDASRALIRGVGRTDAGEVKHGHCVMRDRRDRVATMQWDLPNDRIKAQLSTTPGGSITLAKLDADLDADRDREYVA